MSTTTMRLTRLAIVLALTVGVTAAAAQGVPGVSANKCLAGKTKCVKKKAAGLFKCRAKCEQSPSNCGAVETTCEDKVRAKFEGVDAASSCFGKLEAKQNPASPATICTTTADTAGLESTVDAMVGDLVATLEGNPPPECGDGTLNGDESCEGTNLAGASCLSLGYGSGTLGCTPGCGYDLSGCVPYPPPGSCGNGTIEAPESCDGSNLGGASCTSLGYASGTLACTAFCGYDATGCVCAPPTYPATGQTTCWDSAENVVPCAGTGQDGDVLAGAPLAYVDNGDGTITDLDTGLMWEKKSDDGSVHDEHTHYSWSNAFTVHVATLNGTGFAGYTDWRLPNRRELESLFDLENAAPAVSAAFNTGCVPGCTVTTCSCTPITHYWSSTTYLGGTSYAWFVATSNLYVSWSPKSMTISVRAVRGGL